MIDSHYGQNKSFAPIVRGFFLSLLLIGISYFFFAKELLSDRDFLFVIMGLAVVQALIQFESFLYLSTESKPRWNLMIFLFMLLILVILIGGSLWIMKNVNYNTMPTEKG